MEALGNCTLLGNVTQLTLAEDCRRLALRDALVDSLFIPWDDVMVFLDSTSSVELVEALGDGLWLTGQGSVTQLLAQGYGIDVDLQTGKIIPLGDGRVRQQGNPFLPPLSPLPPFVPPNVLPPDTEKPPPTPDPEPTPPPVLPDKSTVSSVPALCAPEFAGLNLVEKDGVLQVALQWAKPVKTGFPHPDLAQYFQGHETAENFTGVMLEFSPPTPLDPLGTTVLTLESEGLFALGFSSQDNTYFAKFEQWDDRVSLTLTIPNSKIAKSLPLPLILTKANQIIPISIDWGNGVVFDYRVSSGNLELLGPIEQTEYLPPSPESPLWQLSYQRTLASQGLTWQIEDDSGRQYHAQSQPGPLAPGSVTLHWDGLDDAGLPPLPGTLLRFTLTETIQGKAVSHKWQTTLSQEAWLTLLPRGQDFALLPPFYQRDDPAEVNPLLEALWLGDAPLLQFADNLLQVDTAQLTPELESWCMETFGQPALPIMVLVDGGISTLPTLEEFCGSSILWLPLTPTDTGTLQITSDTGAHAWVLYTPVA